MRLNDGRHVTYCGNIHPSDGLDDVLANLERYAVPLKARLAPEGSFGTGLRLSGAGSAGPRPPRLADNGTRGEFPPRIPWSPLMMFDHCAVRVTRQMEPEPIWYTYGGLPCSARAMSTSTTP
jgi:hypothetical protein